MKACVVDDDYTSRVLLKDFLVDEGWDVAEFSHPEKKSEELSEIPEEPLEKRLNAITESPDIDIDVAKAYTELADLIKTGKEILDNSKYVIETNPEDSESVQAAASIINSLKDLTKEFTKIHTGHLEHQRRKELELLRIKGKEELLNKKYNLLTFFPFFIVLLV